MSLFPKSFCARLYYIILYNIFIYGHWLVLNDRILRTIPACGWILLFVIKTKV